SKINRQIDEILGHDGIRRWNDVIKNFLACRDELFRILAGETEISFCFVEELFERMFGESPGTMYPVLIKRDLIKCDATLNDIRVFVKESGNMRWLSLPGTKKHQTFREGVLDEPHILECSVDKATITECFIGIDKPDHSHRVPSCYDLVVETGTYPLIANREKTIFHSLESGIPFRYRQIMLVQEI